MILLALSCRRIASTNQIFTLSLVRREKLSLAFPSLSGEVSSPFCERAGEASFSPSGFPFSTIAWIVYICFFLFVSYFLDRFMFEKRGKSF